MNEEMNSPARDIAIPEPSYNYKRDGLTVALDTVPPTPATEIMAFEIEEIPDHRATGKIASWRGGIILVHFILTVVIYAILTPSHRERHALLN